MSETILTQASPNGNGLTPTPDPQPPTPTTKVKKLEGLKVCLHPHCLHAGEPQPIKRFRGREKDELGQPIIHRDCSTCRWGRRERRKGADDDNTGLNGYRSPPNLEEQLADWVLPPGCEVLEADAAAPGMAREAHHGWCDEGEGVKVLTDPRGRPVVKRGFAGLKPGEVCYVIR